MKTTNIQAWIDKVNADEYEPINFTMTELEDGTWRAALMGGRYTLLDFEGDRSMCVEASTLDMAVDMLDALCMNDIAR